MSELKLRLFKLLCSAWRQRYVIVIPMLILPIIGGIVSYVSAKQYRSHTSMLIQETAKMNPFLEDIAVSTGFKERINGLRTLLKSRHILHSVAREQNLINDDMSPQQQEQVVRQLANSLSVKQIGNDFVSITLTSKNRDEIKPVLESVSKHFIEQLLAPERSSIKDSSEFLSIHINERREALNSAELALTKFQTQHPDISPTLQQENLSRLATLKQNLAEKQALLAGIEKSLGSIDQQLSNSNPVVGRLEEEIIETKSELTLLKAKYTDNHSLVQSKERQLYRLETDRSRLINSTTSQLSSDTLWDIASTSAISSSDETPNLLVTQLHSLQLARAKYESLKAETLSLENMIEELQQTTFRYSEKAKTLSHLQRDTAHKQRLYDELVERYEMAQLTGSLGVFEQNKRVKIIDLPFRPVSPINLPLLVYVLAGLIAGSALGIGLSIIIELFDSSFRYKDELEDATQLPVIATFPNYLNQA
ncbi:chain-length determining protein [Vibrio sp. MACH09]|uniref:GumC family protein n=1 Tax=Vibrio sp. MACH09 TaxID=3025122 RepID=UPI00278DC875|nr:chain-length determining protein [Vibrio sp. MACH09]GLO63433.1 chain-length determining protein [Vibrio sp. MACH09]